MVIGFKRHAQQHHEKSSCHPEGAEGESEDLGTDCTASGDQMRRFFDFANASPGMTCLSLRVLISLLTKTDNRNYCLRYDNRCTIVGAVIAPPGHL